jgi:hypothetical protein
MAVESVAAGSSTTRNNGPVLIGSSWSGEEEEKLLNLIEDRGYGNWSAIGELMEKSAEECKQHYEQFYVRDPLPQMPSLLLPKCCMKKRVVPAYNESLVWEGNPNIKDRPHPVSFGLEGYLPFRGDFSKEWCDKAEEMVANVCGFEQENHSEEDSVITDLKLAVIDRYRLILKQRLCRKRLIRDYGILATNRAGLEDKLVLRKWLDTQPLPSPDTPSTLTSPPSPSPDAPQLHPTSSLSPDTLFTLV